MATGITFDENQLHPVKTNPTGLATGADGDHGIVFSRSVSISKSSTRARSMDRFRRRGSRALTADEEDPETASMPHDFKVKQTFRGRQLFFLAYQSIGVIYGDIGTSPLYVFSSTFTSDPSSEDLVGVLSLLLWSLIIMVTLKYVVLAIWLGDNEGEGGTFSTYSLLARYANITKIDPKEKGLRIERYKTNDMPSFNRKLRTGLENSPLLRGLLKTVGVLAVSMVLSDGALTPAQSVLGAVQGLNVAVPNISNSVVVGVTVAILILLFLIQPLGTTRLGVAFAPIVIIWLLLNGCVGIYNLAKYDYTVLRAFNPGLAFLYLIRNGRVGWLSLGGVLLSFTGLEALFADLGAFSANAIRLSWLGFVLPLLMLTYIGQAAYISVFPDAYSNPVFNCLPGGQGWLIFTLVIAVLAAIVASQAIIQASFQLMSQLDIPTYLPTLKIVPTSKIYHNQMYVPLINWLLMIATVLIAAIYNNTTSLGNAYGVCVIFVTFFDTIMVTLVSLIVWRFKWYWVILPSLAIACMDGAFLSAALTKVPDGAWFTLTLAAVLAAVFISWNVSKHVQWAAESGDRIPLSRFVQEDGEKLQLVQHDLEEISKIRGFGVFFDKIADKTPIVFSQFLEKLVVLPEVTVFLNLRAIETPTIPDEDRYWVSKMRLPNCYRLVIRHGYMDEIITPHLADIVYNQLRRHILTRNIHGHAAHDYDNERSAAGLLKEKDNVALDTAEKATDQSTDESERNDSVTRDIAFLENAFTSRVLYVVGKCEMYPRKSSPFYRKWFLNVFLFVKNNTRNKVSKLPLPKDRLVEIGFVKEI